MLNESDASLFYALLRFEEASLALRAALKLRVVDELGDHAKTFSQLAQHFGFTAQASRTFFSLLSAMRILEPLGDRFSVTTVAKQSLGAEIETSRSPYLGMGMGHEVDQLIDLLRGGPGDGPPLYGEEGGGETLMDIDEVGAAVAHGLSSRARNFATPLAQAISRHASNATSFADIGAGSPYVASACLQAMPELQTAALVDRPNGMRFAKEIAEQQGIDMAKLQFCEQDFFQSVPAADVYCVSNTAHDWLRNDYDRLVKNIRSANSDAIICIHEPLLLSKWSTTDEWLEALWMACYALTLFKLTAGQGSCYSIDEHDAILGDSGYSRMGQPVRTCDGCTALLYR